MSDRLSRRRVLIPSASPGDRIRLAPGEAHHLRDVLRAQDGDHITAVDPSGQNLHAVVASIGAEGAVLVVGDPLASPLPEGPLLLVAPPKGTRMGWLVEKATELGVSEIRPVRAERGALRPAEGQAARWRRVAEAAVKQSGAQLPMILPMTGLEEALAGLAPPILAAHPDPDAVPLPEALGKEIPTFAVGPEGGWSAGELAALREAGARPVRLGPGILRTETAALALLAAWRLRAGQP